MSAGASYPVKFELTAEDRASAALQAVLEVMRQGASASDEAKEKFASFRSEATLQTRAINTLRLGWRAAHADLYLFGRTMATIGSIGHEILNIFNSIMLSQIRYAQSGQQLSQAIANVSVAHQQMEEAIKTWGPTSDQAVTATNNYYSAIGALTSAEASNQLQAVQMNALYLGIALSFGSIIAQGVAAAGAISDMAAAGTLGAAGVSAFAAGVVAIAAALAFSVGYFAAAAIHGDDMKDAFNRWKESVSNLPGPLRFVAEVIGALGAGFVVIGQKIGAALVWVMGQVNTIGSQIGAYLGGLWADITTAASVAWGAIQGFAKTAWDAIVGTIRAGINFVIGLLNLFIGGIDVMINAVNAVASTLHLPTLAVIPTIPTLQAGGIVTRPTLAMIGEAGPEAVVPLGPGRGGGAGATYVTVNLTVQGSVLSEADLGQLVDRHLYTILARLKSV